MTIWLSTGEPSGDRWGALLARALKARQPGVRLVGMCGKNMRKAGVEGPSFPAGGVMGFTAPLAKLGELRHALRECVDLHQSAAPSATVVIDYPDFHLRLLKRLKHGPAIYYLTPQVWAWRSNRARTVARRVHDAITAFQWEQPCFAPHLSHDRLHWFGHPILDDLPEPEAAADDYLALLPGSRPSEIGRLAPTLAHAAREFGTRAVFAARDETAADMIRSALTGTHSKRAELHIAVGPAAETLRRAKAALVCAGTATLESACLGVPTVVVYRTDALTFRVAQALVNVRYCGLPNCVLDHTGRGGEYPELVQNDLTAASAARALETVCRTPRSSWIDLGRGIRTSLRPAGMDGTVCDRVAALVLDRASRHS